MADLKISQLTAATTPLAGTEVLPIVQSSTTVKVAVSDLTAGRAISATAATLSSGNLNFSSTAQRITGDFSNATVANRLAFQTSTTNGNTAVFYLPNGTSQTANAQFHNVNDPTNAANLLVGVTSTDATLRSGITGTGTYLPMTFYTSGSERMRIDTSGNVGIGGTPNATCKLDVIGTSRSRLDVSTATAINTVTNAAASAYATLRIDSADYQFYTGGSEKVRIDSSGNVGIGTASPGYKLDVTGGTGSFTGSSGVGAIRVAGGGGSWFWIDNPNGTQLRFSSGATAGTNPLVLNDSGQIICVGVYNATVGATNRDVYVDDTGLIGYVSSIRASKTNIAPLSDTNWLLQLQPVTFNYRAKDEDGKYTDEADGPQQYGLIAEDVETVAPDLCYYDEVDGQQELRGINYSRLITPLLKLVQDQQDMIADLQIRLAKLEKKA